MASDRSDYWVKPDYWVDVRPEDFQYGRSYQIRGYEIPEGTPVYEIPITGASDSYQINELANIEAIERDASLSDKVAYGRMGSFRNVIVRADEDPSKDVKDVIAALSDYPVLDDMIRSEMESEVVESAWHNWGRKDFIKETLTTALQVFLDDVYGETLDKYDLIDGLTDNDEAVDAVWRNIDGYQFAEVGSEGAWFQFKEVQRELANLNNEQLAKKLEPVVSLFRDQLGPIPKGALRLV